MKVQGSYQNIVEGIDVNERLSKTEFTQVMVVLNIKLWTFVMPWYIYMSDTFSVTAYKNK